MIAKCKSCPNTFTITDNEKDFYKGKGFPLPKRCKDCRQKNRERRNENRPFEGKFNQADE